MESPPIGGIASIKKPRYCEARCSSSFIFLSNLANWDFQLAREITFSAGISSMNSRTLFLADFK
ncbi:TPA: hypothetical protein SMP78_003800 [Proteus mirabilis]